MKIQLRTLGIALALLVLTAKPAAILSILAYQKFISPHDGRNCAYRVCWKGESCSQHTLDVIRHEGLIAALLDFPKQRSRCRSAYLILKTLPTPRAGECSDCVDQAICYTILCSEASK